MLKENLMQVEEKINAACQRAGRARSEVTLIAVSKTKPIPMLSEIYAEGIRNFGENKVQEILEKHEELPNDIKWHMIGHLQRNKVKSVIDKVSLIHSVDSFRLAEEINIQAKKKNITVPILVQVNIAGEDTKFGITREDAIVLTEQIAELDNLRIQGLMTIAPLVNDPEDNRQYFRGIRQLSVDITNNSGNNSKVNELSMGMT
ncbi:MAG: YggS family pyridoxal phosphate-dependent enzyme, partial [Lachnospiraceae bacterium]|nr:YggS family pyridoxal phosphate-dependent enzyme [Lachnospiraceae bacterium]